MAHNSIKSPALPLLTTFIIYLYGLIIHVCTRHDGTFNRRLFSLVDFKASAPATKHINTTRVSTSDITVDPSRNLWFRLFTPSTPNSHSEKLLPLIVYFHGGGFAVFGADSKLYDDLCSHLAAGVPAVIVSVNYRLAPANTDLSKCFIGGDSAGGNIAHHVTIRALQNAEQFYNIRIIGILGVQPFFGGEERTESELRLTKAPLISVKQGDVFWREFLPEGADRNHPAANVFGGGANSEAAAALKNLDFPSSLVIVGGNDPLLDWIRRYVEWLKNCGKQVELSEYPNAFHGFFLFPDVPEFAFFIDDVANFVQKQVTSN